MLVYSGHRVSVVQNETSSGEGLWCQLPKRNTLSTTELPTKNLVAVRYTRMVM